MTTTTHNLDLDGVGVVDVLIDAVGIEVPGHPVADAFSLSLEQITQRSFHDPAPFLVDPTTLPEPAWAVMAAIKTPARAGPTISARASLMPSLLLPSTSSGVSSRPGKNATSAA